MEDDTIEDEDCSEHVRQGEHEDDDGQDIVGDDNHDGLGGGHLVHGQFTRFWGWKMVYEYKKKKYRERKNKTKYEPHVYHLDVGGGSELVGHRLVQRVHDQHGGHRHSRCCLEVFLIEVESALAHNHQAEGGDEGGGQVVVVSSLQGHQHLQALFHLLHLPVDDIVLQHLHRATVGHLHMITSDKY